MKWLYVLFLVLSIALVPIAIYGMIDNLSFESIGLFLIASTGVPLGIYGIKGGFKDKAKK